MPQIKEYTAPVEGLRPTEIGVDATAGAARRIGAFSNHVAGSTADVGAQIGRELGSSIRTAGDEAVNYISHQEISHGAATFAQLQADLVDKWNNTVKNADPNDTSVAGKFNETVLQPALENFQQAFNTEPGQKWAEAHIDALRGHMFEKGSADMSTLAGEAVKVNVDRMVNSWTNTARSDPSSTQYLMDTAESSVAGVVSSSPNLKGVDAAKVKGEVVQKAKEQIAKAGALGAMEKSSDPEKVASTFAERFPEYINGQEIDQFAKAARYYKRLNTSEERADRVQRDYEARIDFNNKVNQLEAATMPQNAGDAPQLPKDYWQNMRQLSTHPGAALEPGRLAAMTAKGEAITNALNRGEPLGPISHRTTMDMLGRIRAGDESRLTDNMPIYRAYEDGKLNRADFGFLINEFNNIRTPEGAALERDRTEFFKRYAGTIDGAMDLTGHSALGSQKMYEAEMEARRQETMLRGKGLDPHLVYDPRSEYFFGKPQNIAKYHVSMDDALHANDGKNINLTAPGKTITGVEVINVPAGMSPSEAMKAYKSGTRIRLPDGRMGTVP